MASYASEFVSNWRQRQAELASRGISINDVQPIIRFDLDRVRQGGQPLADNEAGEMVAMLRSGAPTIEPPAHKTGIADLIGNAGKDVVDIAKGLNPLHLVPAMVKDAANIGQAPKAIGNVLSQVASGHVAEGLQDVAKIPGIAPAALLASFIPGAQPVAMPIAAAAFAAPVAGRAMTEEGRHQIAEHPLVDLLNVLPLTHIKTPFAATPKTALGEVAAETIPNATARQLVRSTQTSAKVHASIDNALRPLGLDQMSRAGWSAVTAAKREAQIKAKLTIEENAEALGHLDPADLHEVYQHLTRRRLREDGTFEPPPAHLEAATTKAIELIDNNRKAQGRELIELPLTNEATLARDDATMVGSVTVAADSHIGKLFQTTTKLEGSLGKRQDALAVEQAGSDTAWATMRRTGDKAEDGVTFTEPRLQPLTEAADAINVAWRDPEVASFMNQARPGPKRDVAELVHASLPKVMEQMREGTGPSLAAATKAIDRSVSLLRRLEGEGLEVVPPTIQALENLRPLAESFIERRTQYTKAEIQQRAHLEAATKIEGSVTKTQKRIDRYYNRMGVSFRNKGPDAFEPVIGEKMRSELLGRITEMHRTGELDATQKALQEDAIKAGFWDEVSEAVIGPEGLDALRRDHMKTWSDLWKQGYRPVYVHKATEAGLHQMLNPRMAGRVESIGQVKERAWDMTPGVQDVLMAVSDAAMEHTLHAIQSNLIYNELPKTGYIKSRPDVVADLRKNYPNISAEEAKTYLRRQWMDLEPESFITFKNAKVGVPRGLEKMMIQRDFAKNLEKLVDPPDAYRKLSSKLMRLHYTTVFFGPRHMAHILFSSLGMMMAESGPAPLRYFRDAYRMVKNEELPAAVPRGGTMVPLELIDPHISHGVVMDTPTKQHQYQAGVDLSHAAVDNLVKKGMSPLKATQHIMATVEEFTSDMNKAMEFLYRKDGGGLSGAEKADFMRLSDAERELRGVEYVSKVFLNFDSAAPIERQLLRSVFPFYSWTRHVMKSVFRLSGDHPVRVAAMEHFARSELQDHESGLPLQWESLLHLGKENDKGEQWVIDGKSLNPFRDVGNYFTLAGVIGSLNPAFGGLLGSLGVDEVSGTPEAYPEQTYDPVSGRLVTKRKNAAAAFLSSYIPQTTYVLEKLTGDGDKGDPKTARQRMLAQLGNMPWTPYQVDPAKRRVQTEHARRKAAASALSGAMRTGNWDEVRRFNLVPFRGKLIDPRIIEAYYKRMEASNKTDIATRALLPNG